MAGQILLTAAVEAMNTFLTIFASEDTTSSDSSDDDEVELPQRKRRKTCDMPRIRNNFISDVVPQYSELEFQTYFRMSRSAFDWLLGKIGPTLTIRENHSGVTGRGAVGRPLTEPKKQLLSVLWLLATSDSFRSVAERFGMAQSILHVCFQRVVAALQPVSGEVCKWPNATERMRIRRKFLADFHIDGIVGVIDSTYIPMKAPHNYVNPECIYGMSMQAICDDNMKFINAFVGWPNSVSDAKIFIESPIFKRITRNPEAHFSSHEFLIGDEAFVTKTYLVPSYKEGIHFTQLQKDFNTQHEKCRSIIEKTFAQFFGRFRRFRYLNMSRKDLIPATVIAGVVLHNICRTSSGDQLQKQFEEEGLYFVRNNPAANPNANDRGMLYDAYCNQEGRLFRDELAREMGLLTDRPPLRSAPVENPDTYGLEQAEQPGEKI